MRVLTAAESRSFDRWASEEIGVPEIVLMENAGLAVADAVVESFPDCRRVAVVCGPGHNGADGLVAARQLATRGLLVDVALATFGAPLAPATAAELDRLERLGLEPLIADAASLGELLAALSASDLIVDALFGTGLSRPLAGPFADLAEGISELGLPVVAVDLPSGLDASSERPIGPAVAADLTVAFVAPKIAHLLPPACLAVGRLAVADLGLPAARWLDEHGSVDGWSAVDLARELPERALDAHKGRFGHLLIVAGGPGKAGAAALAARAAVAGGAGLVTVAAPRGIVGAIGAACLEAMQLPLAEDANGGVAPAAFGALVAAAVGKSAIVIGPGLGTGDEVADLIRRFVLAIELPAILDADAISAFAGRAGELRARRAPTLLTPHAGELARLLGVATAEVASGRLAAARTAAEATGALVLAKGFRSILAAPDGTADILSTGNPGMASGGSGDVLAGLAGAWACQLADLRSAARLAIHLHGAAGDLAAKSEGPAVPAGRIVEHLGQAYRELAAAT